MRTLAPATPPSRVRSWRRISSKWRTQRAASVRLRKTTKAVPVQSHAAGASARSSARARVRRTSVRSARRQREARARARCASGRRTCCV